MNRIKAFFKRIPLYGYLSGILFFGGQYGMYRLGHWIAEISGTIAWQIAPKIALIDDAIPLWKPMIIIYFYSFAFWIMGPIAVSLTKKSNFINFVFGMLLAYFIGFLFFVFMPTYMDRNAEDLFTKIQGSDFFSYLMQLAYGNDGGDLGFNLFPSYHCLISWYCYFGVMKQKEISKGFRIYSLIMAILISASTVLVKQHYFIDIIGGIAVAIISYLIISVWLKPGEKIVAKQLEKASSK